MIPSIALPKIPVSEQQQDLFFTFRADSVPSDKLVVTDFSASESMSTPFVIHIGLASRSGDIDLNTLIDRPALLTIHDRYSVPRYFHGIVMSAERGDRGTWFTAYRVTLMPALARLRFQSDCRIFQEKSVLDIARIILKENHIDDVRISVKEAHNNREYCVQYYERNLDFIERILSEEGISYFFEHTEDTHTLVLTDATDNAKPCPFDSELEYNATSGGTTKGHFIHQFGWRENVTVSEVRQRDHYFLHPAYNYEITRTPTAPNGQQSTLSMYDYPGRYKTDDVGKDFTRFKLEAFRRDASAGEGRGRCQHLSAGGRFSLTKHEDQHLNRPYFLVTVSHHGTQPGSVEEAAGGGGTFLTTSFRCITHLTPWRPPVMAKPVVNGPLMAHVVGPPGEEIFTDEHGRVKVRFPWDRRVKESGGSPWWVEEDPTCFIRVASNWAGDVWGHIAIPRIGQHVVVDFLDGDPDQPVITGRAYHARNMPPYTLPKFKTRMTIQSKTHKGNGYNELRFEDEKGLEEVYFQAEKYHNAWVKDDETWLIGGNRHKRVEKSQSESIGKDKDIEVTGEHREVVDGSYSVLVKKSRKEEVQEDAFLKIESKRVTEVGASCLTKVGENARLETGEAQHLEAGSTWYLNAGDTVVIQAGSEICLNVGGNFVKINAGGVQIEGKLVKVNCGGSPTAGTEVAPEDITPPDPYEGPHAERYGRSWEK